ATSASQSMAHQAQDLLRQVEFFKVQVSSGIIDSETDEGARVTQTIAKKSLGTHSGRSSRTGPSQGTERDSSSNAEKAVGVGSSGSNGYKKVDDDFFEEF
ncbi:MAG: hypothetical protein KC643_26140, partial [Nitrospira sp.]|nr:hypothetical protein [Nitrospira sp.]